MELEARRVAQIFKALCDENRVCILRRLRTGEKCACVLLDDLQITQPTLSHHMKILCESGLVVGRKEGKWTYYTLSPRGARLAAEQLRELTTAVTDLEKPVCGKE